ncbi:ABC transporter substrate-binding protein [Okeania sp. SIO1I7]|uniref:ABC transporter substrate-binding protein n=1 Tax=Okeania sp. SIO1I7 TaxID=2607772 RepID=UPI0013FCD8F7|nr:ABC transporter substrate-binding protein [Okeania sp. SIO1I7]NET29886.1 AAA family ATPase [Okeania sp. SIO1I7]
MKPRISRRNPYVIGRPIDETDLFFGRESLFEFIKDNLRNNQQVILLHGQRRIGKSSILRQIPEKVNLDNEFVFVLSDFQHQSQWSLHEVVHGLANEIVEKLIDKKLIDNRDAIDLPFLENLELDLKQNGVKFREFLEQVYEKLDDKKLVLLLDEFDVLEGKNYQSEFEDFFRYLKSIISYEERLFIIPVVGRRLDNMPKLHNNLFNKVPQLRIGLLDSFSTERLIKNPVGESLEYHKDAVEEIKKLSECHPYFTQGICSALFTQARDNSKTEILPEDVNQVIDSTIELLEPGLIWFRDGLPTLERIVFSAAATAHKSPRQNPLELLKDFGVDIEHENLYQASQNLIENKFLDEDGYKVTIKFVRYWLVQYYPLESSIWEFEELESDASDYYKKANIWRERGKTEDELYHYNKVLELNPNHFSALFRLAELHLIREEFLKASELYERGYKVNPERAKDEYIESLLGAIKLHLEDRKFQEASELYERFCGVNPEGAENEYINLFMGLANSHMNNQEFQEAFKLYERAYKINPETVKDEYIESLLGYGDHLIKNLTTKGVLTDLMTKTDLADFDYIINQAKGPFEKVVSIDDTNIRAKNQLKSLTIIEDNLKNTQIHQGKKHKQILILSAISISLILVGIGFFLGLVSKSDPNFQPEPELSTQPEPELSTQPEPELSAQPEPELSAQPEPELLAQPEPELSDEEKQKRFSSGERTIFYKINEENYNNDLLSCNQDFKDQKYSKAAKCFKTLVKDYPNEPEALIYKNNVFSRKSAALKSTNRQVLAVIVSTAYQDKKYKEMLRGVAQAQDKFNKEESNSSNPTLLEIVIVDDSNDSKTSLKVAREIVKKEIANKSILGVIGNPSEEALEVYEKENLAIISPMSTSTELKSEILFRTINQKQLSKKLARYVKQLGVGVEKVVIFYDPKSPYSERIKKDFEYYFNSDSNRPIKGIDLRWSSFNSIEEKIEVGILFPDLETVQSAINIAVENYKQPQDKRLKLLGSHDLYHCNVLDSGKQAVKDLILAVPWFKGTPEAKKFSTEVKKRWRGKVSWLTAASYDATQAFISALSNSGENPTRSTVLQKVENVYLPANETSGENLKFSPDGEREGKTILVKVIESPSNPDCSNLDFREVGE